MFKIRKNNIIEQRVNEVIKGRIADAQAHYDDGCANVDRELQEKIETANLEANTKKENMVDELVKSIVG